MIMARQPSPWIGVGLDAWVLGLEACTVMGLRTLKIAAGGGSGVQEAERMVSEKVQAAAEWQTLALTGTLGDTAPRIASKTVAHYRRKVRANRRRLTKS
jgi:hypothetical protein